jgi:LysM repeat protein
MLLEQDARPKPPPLRAEYRVVKGDTVSSILRSMGLTKSGLQDVVIDNLHRADDLRAGRVYVGDVLLVPISAPAHDMFLAQARTQRAKRMNEQVVADVIRMTEPDPKEDYWQNLDYGAKMRGLLMAVRNPHHRAYELWKEMQQLATSTPSVPGIR